MNVFGGLRRAVAAGVALAVIFYIGIALFTSTATPVAAPPKLQERKLVEKTVTVMATTTGTALTPEKLEAQTRKVPGEAWSELAGYLWNLLISIGIASAFFLFSRMRRV